MLLLEKHRAGQKSGSNEGPVREATEWGHRGGKINSILPLEWSGLLTEPWPVVGLNRLRQMAGVGTPAPHHCDAAAASCHHKDVMLLNAACQDLEETCDLRQATKCSMSYFCYL